MATLCIRLSAHPLQLPTLIAHTAINRKASKSATPDENISLWPRRRWSRPKLLRSSETVCGVVSQSLYDILETLGRRFSGATLKKRDDWPICDVLNRCHPTMNGLPQHPIGKLVAITLRANGT